MSDLDRAVEQIAFARGYTLRFLEGLEPAEWTRVPPAGVTHIAWQVGHLTFSQYRLALLRIRGQKVEDKDLIPEEFVRIFSSKSTPEEDASRYPSADALRVVFDRVHARVLQELSACDPSTLDQPLELSHPIAKTKLAALFWCSAHELVHSGQIALIRRQLGHPPLW
jgi:hypothetical protein